MQEFLKPTYLEKQIYKYKDNLLMAALWKELHMRALTYEGLNDTHFISVWSGKIPRYTSSHCRCAEFWGRWRTYNPPNFAKDKYFKWTVEAHNAVNSKLKKPLMTYEEALSLYSTILLEQQQQHQQQQQQLEATNTMTPITNINADTNTTMIVNPDKENLV
jgi:hypothetical protein